MTVPPGHSRIPIVLGAFVAGLLLRLLAALHAHSLWGDEAWSIRCALLPTIGEVVAECARDTHPPLYFLLLRAVLQVSPGESAARLFSAVASVLMLWILLRGGQRDPRMQRRGAFALWACWIAASPFLLQSAGEARSYALQGLFATSVTFLVLRLQEAPSAFTTRSSLFLAASLAGMLYVHYFGFLLIGATMIAGAVSVPRSQARRWLVPVVIAVVASVPSMMSAMRTAAGRDHTSRALVGDLKRAAGIPINFTSGYYVSHVTVGELVGNLKDHDVLLFFLCAAATVVLLGCGALRDRPWADPRGRALVALLLVPVTGAWAMDIVHFNARYLTIAVPAFLLLAGRALAHLPPAALWLFAGLWCASSGRSLIKKFTISTDVIHREDFRALARYFDERPEAQAPGAGAWILGDTYVFQLYLPAGRGPEFTPSSRPMATGVEKYQRFYVLLGKTYGWDLSPGALAERAREFETATKMKHRETLDQFGEDLRVLVFSR